LGKRIRAQKIGRGSPSFRASLARHYRVGYPSELIRAGKVAEGVVKSLNHDPGRGVPVAEVSADGSEFAVPAVEGLHVGQLIRMGDEAEPIIGNIVPVGKLPEGTAVSSVELHTGDGGKLARASGTYGTISAQIGNKTVIRLPSKRTVEVSAASLAIVGTVAGGGRDEKPFLKAGSKHYWMKAKHRPYPRVRGVAMASVVHPFGGGSHRRIGRPETVSRTAPPGRKVGLIAARRTGKRRRAD